jgi:hypothetical protein
MKRLIKWALVIGAVAFAARMISTKKAEWEGLTEAEVRDRIDARMPEKVSAEKRASVADRVVARMRASGKLAEDGAAPVGDESDD